MNKRKIRFTLGKFFIRLGKFIESWAVAVMKPDDLVEFSKQSYQASYIPAYWNRPTIVDKGLEISESALFENLPLREGRLLVLGVGSGREAIVFAKKGFQVTGLDFVSEMVTSAKKNASERGIEIDGLVQEISELSIPQDSFDVIWISFAMYSSIPGKKRRIRALEKIKSALRPGGYFICQFSILKSSGFFLRAKESIRKLISWITWGNLDYEEGDSIWHGSEFLHHFSSKEVVQSEFQKAGFEGMFFCQVPGELSSGAVLRKPENSETIVAGKEENKNEIPFGF